MNRYTFTPTLGFDLIPRKRYGRWSWGLRRYVRVGFNENALIDEARHASRVHELR